MSPAASPGLSKKHYAPRARVLFFSGPAGPTRTAMHAAVQEELARGHRAGLLLYQEDLTRFAGLVAAHRVRGTTSQLAIEDLGPSSDPAVVGQRLFAAMRRLDALGVDVICVRSLPAEGLGLAIADRLTRAAGGHVVRVG